MRHVPLQCPAPALPAENGMQVIAYGRVTVFPRDGAYQLYCSALTADGAGDLYVAFEQLKEKLSREGLFDPAHKKPLPRYPHTCLLYTALCLDPAVAAVLQRSSRSQSSCALAYGAD